MERPLRDVAGVVLLVALLLIVACSRPPDSQEIAVVPATSLVPLAGGAYVPDPARVLLVEADRRLRAGDYEGAIVAANEAEERSSTSSSAPLTRTPTWSPRATTTLSPAEVVRAVAAVYRKL